MYIFIPTVLAVMLVSWFLLRRLTKRWIEKPPSAGEAMFNGVIAWIFIVSILSWFAGILLLLFDFLSTHETTDILVLVFLLILTGYGFDFYFRTGSDAGVDDTADFIKEELQFRRSGQRRLDLLSLIELRRIQRRRSQARIDSNAEERSRLQADLDKGKDLENQLALLRENKPVDIIETWRLKIKTRSPHPLYNKIDEARLEPDNKRLILHATVSDLDGRQLADETAVLRFNRQVYDFFQSLSNEPWLKPYTPFIEGYFLLCRTEQPGQNGEPVLYPFMKVNMLISDLRRLEGTYFNPRRLGEVSTLLFNNGAPV
jgi:hypothetical protein